MAAALRLASLRLRDCRWCSTQLGQRVWPGMAGAGQLLHLPVALAIRRRSWARRRLYSLRSGVLFLTFSYARPFWRVPLVLAKGVSWGVLSPLSWWTLLFGFGEPLVPAFGSFRVFGSAFLPGPAALEGVLLRWALPGRGKENSKVRPSTRAGGACRVLRRIFERTDGPPFSRRCPRAGGFPVPLPRPDGCRPAGAVSTGPPPGPGGALCGL